MFLRTSTLAAVLTNGARLRLASSRPALLADDTHPLAIAEDSFDQARDVVIHIECFPMQSRLSFVTEATLQALAFDAGIAARYDDVPWHEIRGTGNRVRHGYATLDRRVVHDVVEKDHIDRLVAIAREELKRYGS